MAVIQSCTLRAGSNINNLKTFVWSILSLLLYSLASYYLDEKKIKRRFLSAINEIKLNTNLLSFREVYIIFAAGQELYFEYMFESVVNV